MNYARDSDEFTPITCIDGFEQPVAFLGVHVIEEPGRAAMVACDQSTAVKIFGDGCALARMDVELFRDLRGGKVLRRTSPKQQQRLQVRHAVDLIKDELVDLFSREVIDIERFVRHRLKTQLFRSYIGSR